MASRQRQTKPRRKQVATLQPLKHGDPVEVIETPLSMVTTGDKGVVDKEHEGGYWVTIEKYYPSAMIGEKGRTEKRTWWFKRKEIKVATLQS